MSKKTSNAYITLQEDSGIAVGDIVRVLRIAENKEMGWTNNWYYEMDNYVGTAHKVIEIYGDGGIELDNEFLFPFFVLEKLDNHFDINSITAKYEGYGKFCIYVDESLIGYINDDGILYLWCQCEDNGLTTDDKGYIKVERI